jgi:hypothetical protein
LLTECADDVRQGAVFVDPDGRLDGWLLFLEGEVRDGTNQVAGKQIFALYRSASGDIRLINPSVLWDLMPYATQQKMESQVPENDVIAYAVDHVLEPYRAELLKERERMAAIKRKYGLRSLEHMILESGAKLLEYETRRAKGENLPGVELLNEQRRKEELEMRKQALEEEIRRETSLLPSTPKILGMARVFPHPAADQSMRSDAEIEAIGMQVAMQYERKHGRNPEDVSAHNLGYDIRSTSPSGEVRYIEVKARATTGAIVLTPNEWLMAQRFGEEYWLYIVEHAASNPQLHTIQNPAAKLHAQQVVETVRYVITDWSSQNITTEADNDA